MAALGAVALIALTAPNAFQILGRRYRRGDWWREREARRERIREAIERLKRRRLITYEEEGKETYIRITSAGKEVIKKFDFMGLKLTHPKRWDNKWRIVTFDIPETKATNRNALRGKLEELGFRQLQKSMWFYPHDCRDEIDFVTHFLEVASYVLYLEAADLGPKEGWARSKFNLLV